MRKSVFQRGLLSPCLFVLVAFVLRFGIMFATQGSGPLPVRGYIGFGYVTAAIAAFRGRQRAVSEAGIA